ncbi:YwqG family protein [Streptomyces sp. rh34]|uniref:YwqG family protein n=1 Tax=Streptomyces sp. rh34 TaxID=2034272 RepID=UPI00211D3FC7|nr:YwqG family protein [Streptomyces sp. rh34]
MTPDTAALERVIFSGMDHQGEFRRAALELGIPDDEVSRFSQHLRLSIELSGAGGGSPVGQFGGLPRLPVGMKWPSAGDSPLPMLFSVDCGALPRVDGFDLPEDGTLLFFVDQEMDHEDGSGRYARVVYVPDGTETAVAEAPGSVCVRERFDVGAELGARLPLWLQEGDEDWHEYWEDFDWEDMSPFQQQLVRYMERDLPHLDELRDLAHDLWPSGASVFIGGYADDEVINSIAEQTLAGREKAGEIPAIPIEKWYSHLEKEKHRLTSEWISLAGESPVYEEYYTSFVIRHDDLAAVRVDKALPVTNFEAP